MRLTAMSLFKQMLCNANRSSVDHDSGRYWIIFPTAETGVSKSPNPVNCCFIDTIRAAKINQLNVNYQINWFEKKQKSKFSDFTFLNMNILVSSL